ncbi:MAG: acyltransferase [Gemmatimonadaceae bacterium]|nr:acyltransferase [Acetobacteraceae bacterium]
MSHIRKNAWPFNGERRDVKHVGFAQATIEHTKVDLDHQPRTNYATLQALRAFAAGLVVFYHTNQAIFGNPKYWLDRPFGDFLQFGRAGVEFFFVLSGFIIYAAHRRDIGRSGQLAGFAWKRFRRVYPVYWLLLFAVVPIYFTVPSFGDGTAQDAGTVVDSVLLIHIFGTREILTVSWTLFHEIAFYGVFALLIVNRLFGGLVMGAWLVSSAVWAVMPSIIPPGIATYLSPLNLLFGMGMGAAWVIGRMRPPLPWALTCAGTVLFLGAGAEEAWGDLLARGPLAILYGIGSSLIVVGAVELERAGKVRVPRALVFLGNASYSVYLVHFVALSMLAKAAVWAVGYVAIPHALIFLFLVAGSVTAGVVYHVLVEIPLLRAMARIKPLTGRKPVEAGDNVRRVRAPRRATAFPVARARRHAGTEDRQ